MGSNVDHLLFFFSDPSIPNRFYPRIFLWNEHSPKSDFFQKFKLNDFFLGWWLLQIGILYLITSFFTSSEISKLTILKLYFDLVESGHYANFSWGNKRLNLTLKACSHKLLNNPTSFKFSQFHIAIQFWFYKCCLPFDNTIVVRASNSTPHILNWKTTNDIIFLDDLKNMIFITHGNQVIF